MGFAGNPVLNTLGNPVGCDFTVGYFETSGVLGYWV